MEEIMKKSQTKIKEIPVDTMFEIIENEIDSYDIRENGAMEKKMCLIKLKKEFQKYLAENKI